MFDRNLLKPFCMCPYTRLEKRVAHIFGSAVKIYQCKETRKIRLVVYNEAGAPVAGLLVNPYNRVKTYTIDAVYTLTAYRRMGYAKQLLAVARFTLGTVKHSDNLTGIGEQWRNSVESLK